MARVVPKSGRDRLEIIPAITDSELYLPLLHTFIPAGFPSPAGDFIEQGIDLNKELIQHPSATYYARVRGNSMIKAGIFDDAILVIDRSLPYQNGNIVVCYLDGEYTVKRLDIRQNCCYLVPENDQFSTIQVTEENDFIIWGVVIWAINPCL